MIDEELERRVWAAAEFRAEVGRALARARQESGLSRRELAKRMGYSLLHVARLERGGVSLPIGEVGRILAVMGRRLVLRLEPLEGEKAEAGGERT